MAVVLKHRPPQPGRRTAATLRLVSLLPSADTAVAEAGAGGSERARGCSPDVGGPTRP